MKETNLSILELQEFPFNNAIGKKRVKFNSQVDQYLYDAPPTPEESSQHSNKESNTSQSDEDSSSNEEISSADECGSDPEDMESGAFFDYIQNQTQIAERERKFVMKKLKAKTRVGSIFFDKVHRVIAAV